jgi:hypothetical protein
MSRYERRLVPLDEYATIPKGGYRVSNNGAKPMIEVVSKKEILSLEEADPDEAATIGGN